MMVFQSAFAMEKNQHHKYQHQDSNCRKAITGIFTIKQAENNFHQAVNDYQEQKNKENYQVQLKKCKMHYINALNKLSYDFLSKLSYDKDVCNSYEDQFENVKESIKCHAVFDMEMTLTLKGMENDDYIIFFKTLKQPTELECKDDKFKEIRQKGLDEINLKKIKEIIKDLDLYIWIGDDEPIESVGKTEEKFENVLSAENNIKYLEQIIQISIDSPSLETETTDIVGVAIRVSKRLNKPVTPKSTVVNSKDETNNVDVTDRKCCKYFTIVSCIIIIVIVVVILFSENDEEEEEEKEEDEENPNTPADIEEGSSQDLGNSESIKHAIDNMNVVHKGNKVVQIASSREKIDVDGLVDVNATVEEVHVSE